MSRYSNQTTGSISPSLAIDDSKKKTSRLRDGSWIRKPEEEHEPVDRDPNFGKSVLSRYNFSETAESSEPEEPKSPKVRSPSSSVLALTKRFGGSQDELNISTLPSSKTTPYTKSNSYSSLNPDTPKRYTTTTSNTTVLDEPKTSSTTKTITNNGQTTETTTSTRYSGIKSPTKTETFTERVRSSSKVPAYSSYSPTKTTRVTETFPSNKNSAEDKLYDSLLFKNDLPPTDSKTTVSRTVSVNSSSDDSQDRLYDTLLPKSIKDDFSSVDSLSTVTRTETVVVKSSPDRDNFKTTTTTRTFSSAEDDLYDTLLPKSITSPASSLRRDVVTVDSSRGRDSPTLTSPSSTRTFTRYSSYTDDSPTTRTTSHTISSKPSYEYTSITSPTVHSPTSYRSSRSEDILTEPLYSISSTKSVYAAPARTVHERDLCTYCHKPFTAEAKMVLDDMKIKCHATCFMCEVCNRSLGHLKAGDSMWIYKRMVHCENCFEITRDKWRR